MNNILDVLCLGHASYDLIFSVPYHPKADEKIVADDLLGCGGGPAANAAVMVAKLGYKAGFCGYLGNDVYGQSHWQELQALQVDTRLLVRGEAPTPLSAILVKPDGKRALINYKGQTQALPGNSIDFSHVNCKVVLYDGHEPELSLTMQQIALQQGIASVLDAGSLHAGTLALLDKVDYLVCSEKFARQYAGNIELALSQLSAISPVVVITLGELGIIWQRGLESGALPAPPVSSIVDTTGAGDAFHGAFAAGLATGLDWLTLLRFASAAGVLCCSKLGARPGLPDAGEIESLLVRWT